jgi:putative transposase
MSYSIDLRERVITFIEQGGSKVDASVIFGVSRPTIYSWIRKKAATGSVKDAPLKRGWKKINPEKLKAYVKEHPDLTLADYAKRFGASIPSVCIALKKLKITHKKKRLSIEKGMRKGVQNFWSI